MTDGIPQNPAPLQALRRLWAHLAANRRRSAKLLVGLMLAHMMLEMAGLGAVLPVMTVLLGGGAGLPLWFPQASQPQAVTLAMAGLVILFGVKALFQSFVIQRTTRFSYGVQADLSRQLYHHFLAQPYPFHLTRNAAQLINTINNEARDAGSAIQNALLLLAETILIFGVLAVLLLVSPLVGLVIGGVVLAVGGVILRQTRQRLTRWGDLMRTHQALRMQQLQYGFDSIKEIRLRGHEAAMVAAFDRDNRAYADACQHFTQLNALPRLWLEFLGIAGLALLVIVLQAQDRPTAALVPLIGLLAAAAFRVIPSINRIVNGAQSLRYLGPTVCHVASELDLGIAAPQAAPGLLPWAQDIVFDRVSYCYPTGQMPVLDGFSARIKKGDFVGVVGESGAGKSSFVDLLNGLLEPSAGQILVDGASISTAMRAWQRGIGYVPQMALLTDESLRRNVAFGRADADIDDQAVRAALAAVQFDAVLKTLPEGLETRLGDRGSRLSGGQRQRVAIARALYHQPQLLIVDEGTNAMDAAAEAELVQTLQALRGSVTIVFVSHRPDAIKGCDQIISIDKRAS